ncbi:hypothetical protein R8Z50_20395 [Longispora sp. K20-0274]
MNAHRPGSIEELLAAIDAAWAEADLRRPRRPRPVRPDAPARPGDRAG